MCVQSEKHWRKQGGRNDFHGNRQGDWRGALHRIYRVGNMAVLHSGCGLYDGEIHWEK